MVSTGHDQVVHELGSYFEQMSVPKPFVVRTGDEFKTHQTAVRDKLLECLNLAPLPARVPLDVRTSDSLDHPWCTVTRVYYQLWPDVYSDGYLYMPKELAETPAPAVLCPHGHWPDGVVHPVVQTRCLVLARKGYVVFSSRQHHYEDLAIGVSHQTLMVWNNMRALDYLCTLDEVDRERIGCCGVSGGGLQTEMLGALDRRVRVATIGGLTCDFREILFPYRAHCWCNHFPGVMQFTDHPEISALRMPAPVQYLTMDDWTKTFQKSNFPTIQRLYASNGVADRADCMYWPTEHTYDAPKRERTYWWMDKWLRSNPSDCLESEPDDVQVFPKERLEGLCVHVPEDKGFAAIGEHYRSEQGYRTPVLSSRQEWKSYRQGMLSVLKELLGETAVLERETAFPQSLTKQEMGEFVVERLLCPSEGPIMVPIVILRLKQAQERMPVVLLCDAAGKESLLQETGPGSATELARAGILVLLADVRFAGELALDRLHGKIIPDLMSFRPASALELSDENPTSWAWYRNSIVWGRPLPAMTCTDLRAVLDGLADRADVDWNSIRVISRGSGLLAVGALFAALEDRRLTSADLDLHHFCFAQDAAQPSQDPDPDTLGMVPFVLRYGDILQWAALMADRTLTLRRVPEQAGRTTWLRSVFAVLDNAGGLTIEP